MMDKRDLLYRDGLTIRDHFAGRALQAMLAASFKNNDAYVSAEKRQGIAVLAYEMADAMLEVRSR